MNSGNQSSVGSSVGGSLSRRQMLKATSLAATAGALTRGTAKGAAFPLVQESAPQGFQVGKEPGKHEPLENFKYDLENSKGWVGEGGSAKEVTVDEFPISKSIAGVSMRLKPGGIRELHWHAISSEWAMVVKGKVRTTVIAPNGEAATDDFGPGDTWYFPRGHGHSLKNIGTEEAHFILGFDDGHFSEFGTFSITDWVAHTPPGIAARNLNLSLETVAKLPTKELYIIPGAPAPAMQEPYRGEDVETPQSPHKFRLEAMTPHVYAGGWEKIVSSIEFPIQKRLTAALQYLEVGALRELHWHPNADEWQYYLSGSARVTIFGAHGRAKTEEFKPGQVGFVPQGFGHYVEQVGDEPTKFILLFNSPVFEEISISKWLAGNPASLVADNFQISREQVDRMPKKVLGILKKS
jgi:oxalate decarboxylase